MQVIFTILCILATLQRIVAILDDSNERHQAISQTQPNLNQVQDVLQSSGNAEANVERGNQRLPLNVPLLASSRDLKSPLNEFVNNVKQLPLKLIKALRKHRRQLMNPDRTNGSLPISRRRRQMLPYKKRNKTHQIIQFNLFTGGPILVSLAPSAKLNYAEAKNRAFQLFGRDLGSDSSEGPAPAGGPTMDDPQAEPDLRINPSVPLQPAPDKKNLSAALKQPQYGPFMISSAQAKRDVPLFLDQKQDNSPASPRQARDSKELLDDLHGRSLNVEKNPDPSTSGRLAMLLKQSLQQLSAAEDTEKLPSESLVGAARDEVVFRGRRRTTTTTTSAPTTATAKKSNSTTTTTTTTTVSPFRYEDMNSEDLSVEKPVAKTRSLAMMSDEMENSFGGRSVPGLLDGMFNKDSDDGAAGSLV